MLVSGLRIVHMPKRLLEIGHCSRVGVGTQHARDGQRKAVQAIECSTASNHVPALEAWHGMV